MKKLNVKVDLEQTKLKLYERLKASGWSNKLRTFILSDAMDTILLQLLKEANDGQRFSPVLKQVFRAFEECPYKDLKVVMLGQSSYPYPKIADGIAFSSSNTGYIPPSLRYMFQEINTTVYPNEPYTQDPDLARWSNQGILMINTALTTTIGKVDVHYEMWKPFIGFLFDILNSYNPGLVYCFLGNVAKGWSDQVSDNNHKLFAKHPAHAAHTLKETWDSDNLFPKISSLVKSHYNYDIIW